MTIKGEARSVLFKIARGGYDWMSDELRHTLMEAPDTQCAYGEALLIFEVMEPVDGLTLRKHRMSMRKSQVKNREKELMKKNEVITIKQITDVGECGEGCVDVLIDGKEVFSDVCGEPEDNTYLRNHHSVLGILSLLQKVAKLAAAGKQLEFEWEVIDENGD